MPILKESAQGIYESKVFIIDNNWHYVIKNNFLEECQELGIKERTMFLKDSRALLKEIGNMLDGSISPITGFSSKKSL